MDHILHYILGCEGNLVFLEIRQSLINDFLHHCHMDIVLYTSKRRVDGNIYPLEYFNSNQKYRKMNTNAECDFTTCIVERDATIDKYELYGLTPSIPSSSK